MPTCAPYRRPPPQVERRWPAVGACDFPYPTTTNARDLATAWTPNADPSILLFAPAPIGPGLDPTISAPLPSPSRREPAPDADHLVFGAGPHAHVVRLLDALTPGQPVAVVVPLDAGLSARLAALERFGRWRLGEAVAGLHAARLTSHKQHRIGLMLRAVDARAAGASHRQLAQALYGAPRVAAEPWKTSSLRDATLRLARDGAVLVTHGYRRLLAL